ncbi:hypothetical protein BZM26_28110, partial [Paraburkholderia strydomiana]
RRRLARGGVEAATVVVGVQFVVDLGRREFGLFQRSGFRGAAWSMLSSAFGAGKSADGPCSSAGSAVSRAPRPRRQRIAQCPALLLPALPPGALQPRAKRLREFPPRALRQHAPTFRERRLRPRQLRARRGHRGRMLRGGDVGQVRLDHLVCRRNSIGRLSRAGRRYAVR